MTTITAVGAASAFSYLVSTSTTGLFDLNSQMLNKTLAFQESNRMHQKDFNIKTKQLQNTHRQYIDHYAVTELSKKSIIVKLDD